MLQGHVIPIDKETTGGWGQVELPADTNPQDNVFFFAFGPQPEHGTIIVSDDPHSAEPLRLAAMMPVDPAVVHSAEVVSSNRAGEIDFDTTAMILWQADLPDDSTSNQLQQFIDRGRSIIFFPPDVPGDAEVFGARWGDWQSSQRETPVAVGSWRDDSGLLTNTMSGEALPVGELKTYRYCSLESDGNVLARFESGDPLLTQAGTDAGAVYFCSTLPRLSHSSLARDGVVFYVMLQRALASGASSLGETRHLAAGTRKIDASQWEPRSPSQTVLSSARQYHAGVYSSGAQLIALNRPAGEDGDKTLSDEKVGELFAGLDYYLVNDQLGSTTALASEIWKAFLVLMAIALVAEALLCIPPQRQRSDVGDQRSVPNTANF